MGPSNRRSCLIAAALVAGAAGLVGLYLGMDQGRAGGQEASPPLPFLTVHGPNDGEPLNNSIDFKLDSRAGGVSYVIIYNGCRYVALTPVFPREGGGEASARIQLDSTRFANGKLCLTFYLWDEHLDHLFGSVTWTGKIENPVLAGELPSGGSITIQMRGRSGDIGWMLAVGQDTNELLQLPMGKQRSQKVRLLATGLYFDRTADGMPCCEIVLNLDDLVQVHTQNGLLLLWSYDPRTKWSHSKLVTLKSASEGSLPPIRPIYSEDHLRNHR